MRSRVITIAEDGVKNKHLQPELYETSVIMRRVPTVTTVTQPNWKSGTVFYFITEIPGRKLLLDLPLRTGSTVTPW